MAADDLVMQGTRASAVTVLAYFAQTIPVYETEALTHWGFVMSYSIAHLGQH